MYDVDIVGIPLAAILAGILFNRSDVKDLRGEMKDLRSEMAALRSEVHAGFARVDADLRQFFHVTGKLDGWI